MKTPLALFAVAFAIGAAAARPPLPAARSARQLILQDADGRPMMIAGPSADGGTCLRIFGRVKTADIEAGLRGDGTPYLLARDGSGRNSSEGSVYGAQGSAALKVRRGEKIAVMLGLNPDASNQDPFLVGYSPAGARRALVGVPTER